MTFGIDPITIVHGGFQGGQSVRISGIIWLEDIVEKLHEKHDVRQEYERK